MEGSELWRELGQQLRVDSVRAAAVPKSGHPTSSHVGGRPDGGAAREAPPVRLRRSGRPAQRPSRLLQGPRVAAPVLDVQGRRRDHGRGAAHVPQVREPTRGPPGADPAVGGRGDRLAGPGSAVRRGHRARGQAARQASVPDLGAVRRQRDGRGLDLGGVRARLAREARQPDRDHRRQPARPARRDDARLGSRLVREARRGVRLACDRDRRPRRGRDRRRVRRGARDDAARRP